jgi:nicotinamidase-related amidase
MLHYFADPAGRCFLPAAAAVAPRIRLLLEAWRELGGTVAYTRHCHEGEHDLGMLGRFFGDHIHAGKPEAEIIDLLEPMKGEAVFPKTTYDAFHGTGLEALLRETGSEQLLVTGVLTHMCCETTARSAFCKGYEVYVPADATASSCEERHLQSLKSMADCVAVVLSVEEVLERCARTTS